VFVVITVSVAMTVGLAVQVNSVIEWNMSVTCEKIKDYDNEDNYGMMTRAI
jgi:hypothetical protein